MSSRKGGSDSKHDDAEFELSEDDLGALDEFCSEFGFEEISFEAWSEITKSLDLTLHLQIPMQDAYLGCTRNVEYTRTTFTDCPRLEVLEREKATQEIKIPSGSEHQTELTFKGYGDKRGNIVGDLKIVLTVSDA